MDPFASVVSRLNLAAVQFLVIGVWGANYYAHGGSTLFSTEDRDLFLPSDAGTVVMRRTTTLLESLPAGRGDA